jgi:hypothetical protein
MPRLMHAPGSPFARSAAALIEMGYSPVVIIPGEKRPGKLIHRDGERRWVGDFDWQRFCDRQPSEFEIYVFSRWPEGGLGVAHGRASGSLGSFDLDEDTFGCHTAILEALDRLGGIPVARRGERGQMRYVRLGPGVQSWVPTINKQRVFELMGHGRQSVLPPTPHPNTGQPYYWVTSDTLSDTPPSKLPLVAGEWLQEEIQPILKAAGWDEEPEPQIVDLTGDGWWSDVNRKALAALPVWVHDLRLPVAELLAEPRRRLIRSEERLVVTLRAEVVDDREHRLPTHPELPGE